MYALAAISVEDRLFIETNFGESVASIYIDVAIKMIELHKSLRILSAVQPLYGEQCSEFGGQLPSWVPNWSKESPLASFGLSDTYHAPYDALTKFENDNELFCYGVELGT